MLRVFTWMFLALLSSVVAVNSLFAAGLGVTPTDQFSLLPGFEAELLYDVPSDTEGSWVSLTVDPKGRLIRRRGEPVLNQYLLPASGILFTRRTDFDKLVPVLSLGSF